MKHTVIIKISGLQEHEGRVTYEAWGEGEGNTLQEVCEDIIRRNPGKAKTFKAHSPDKCSDWGFHLILLPGPESFFYTTNI